MLDGTSASLDFDLSTTTPDSLVMYVITGLDRGGAESQLVTLLSAGAPGMGRSVVVSLLPGGAYRADIERAGIPVHDLGATRGSLNFPAFLRLVRLIRRYRPRILHAWMYHAQLLATIALGVSGCWRATRLIWGVRCSTTDFACYGRWLRSVVRACAWLSRLPDAVLFNSEAGIAAHRDLGFRPRRVELIDNGVDTGRFRPSPSLRGEVRTELGIAPTTDLVAHVARVDPVKDHATFFAAMGRLDGAEALLIGPDTERLATPANVHALGACGGVERLLAASDIVVSSSVSEGFSNVLAEGMAAGLPAVATDVGDSARIVGDTGRIVPPRDPAALAEAMGSLLGESKSARAARGVEARRRVETCFSVAHATDAYRSLYASLDSRRAVPSKPMILEDVTDTAPAQPKSHGRAVWLAMVTMVSVVCMALAVYAVDFDAGGRTLGSVEPRYAALSAVLILCGMLVTLVRFRVVLSELGYLPAWRSLFGAFSVGMIGNKFVLNVIGQSLGRAGALTTTGVPVGATIIATFIERILAVVVLGVGALATAWLVLPRFGFDLVQGGAYILSLAGGVALAVLAAVAVSYRSGAATHMIAAGRSASRFWPVALLSVLAHCFMLGGYLAALLAMGVEALTLEVAGCLLIVMFVASLPISLGGWGVREMSAVAVLGAVGIGPAAAFGAALGVGIFSLGITLCIALPGLFLVSGFGFARVVGADSENARLRLQTWNARLAIGCGALIAVLIFFQVRLQVGGEGQVAANAADVFALIGLVSLPLLLADSRDRLGALPRPLVGALLALSLLLVFGLVHGYAGFGASAWALVNRGFGWLIVLGYVAAGLSIALVDAQRSRRVRRVLLLFVAAGAAVAASQVVLTVFFAMGLRPPPEAFSYPLRGWTFNQNAFGFQMIMTSVAAVVADRLGLMGAGRRSLAAVLVLTGLAIYFTGSRMGIGLFVVLLALSVATTPPAERRAALAMAALVAVGVAVAAVTIVALPSMMTALGLGDFDDIWIRSTLAHRSSDLERWQTIVADWRMWLERPIFGHGLGAHVHSQLAETEAFVVFHSVPIWLMAEMGLVGLGVGVAAVAGLVLAALRMMRDSDPTRRAWGAGLLMALACWCAANLVHDFAFQRPFWFFVGLAFGLVPARDGAVEGGAGARGRG